MSTRVTERGSVRADYVSSWDQPFTFMVLGASGDTYIGDILLAQLSGLTRVTERGSGVFLLEPAPTAPATASP